MSNTTTEPEFVTRLRKLTGTELGVTDWFTVSQKDADLFSALTDDWDYMHNDPGWATPRFGGTIAHGFYVLSLIPHFHKELSPDLPIVAADDASVLNYGLDRVRFVSPLLIGERARDRIKVLEVTEPKPGNYLTRYGHTVEKESGGKPFLVAESLSYYVTGYSEKWDIGEK